MATFITLLRARPEGLGPVRLATLRRAVRDNGGRLADYYLTSGEYDAVFLTEARDESDARTITAALEEVTDVEASTMRAWPASDIRADVPD